MNPRLEHQTLRVHEQMPFSAFDLLGPVLTALIAAHDARGLGRLTVHYPGAGPRAPIQAYPHAPAKGGVHPLPGAIEPPSPEVVVDSLPGRSKS
jgi:hypothetical protein